MKLLDIATVAERSGLKPSTLRYYEEKGLIHALSRHGLRRQYGPEVLQQLALVAMGKMAGFALDEIAAMFGPSGRPEVPRADLQARSDAMLKQARQLEVLAQMLRHVADCPEPNHLECGKFQKLLRLATKAQKRAGRTARG
ncbi:helix-turn-helix domain-containing protein [Phaeobacter sp. B1627]|uniref:helix-turn-helix domain-containing protein n=1 Tax=Phaeobacter sp. B1627 TaxID=2583809 RepID=UPI001117FE51|nr:helix-turn-helix domain-containing protein [Phaeobacter sp. B1627]TNJ41119.1 MerR family transcriptional regulator [Phaeobacter sp. B1627]